MFTKECLIQIIECLKNDKLSLRKCLFVNRSWCEIAANILWKNIFEGIYFDVKECPKHVPLVIIGTLISCFSKESKELLVRNGILIPTPTSEPMFDYISLSTTLSIDVINILIEVSLTNNQENTLQNFNFKKRLLLQEFLRHFMIKKQGYPLITLRYSKFQDIPFIEFPGAEIRLSGLSTFCCDSNLDTKFFHQLSQICQTIRSLTIKFEGKVLNVSDGLKDLISSQKCLRFLILSVVYEQVGKDWENITVALEKHHDTLKRLRILSQYTPSSFIASFNNIEELSEVSFQSNFDGVLQSARFPNLQTLKLKSSSEYEIENLKNFLDNNGNNLKVLELDCLRVDESIKSSIVPFCPNLTRLCVIFKQSELLTLRNILGGCLCLESITVWCGGDYLDEVQMFDVIVRYSEDNFHELKIYNNEQSSLRSGDLRSFFQNWRNRGKPVLTLISAQGDPIKEHFGFETKINLVETIEEYKKLGVIKYGFMSSLYFLEIAKFQIQ